MLIEDVLVKAKDVLYTESMVKELCGNDVSDYQRGVVQGRIDMLSWIETRLDGDDDEDNSLSE
jgi:hypothetical protein